MVLSTITAENLQAEVAHLRGRACLWMLQESNLVLGRCTMQELCCMQEAFKRAS